MGSPLDFVNSDGFRKKLITKNLPAYDKSPKKYSPPLNYEYRQSDFSVVDSPDGLIDTTVFSEKLYPLNQYGTEGGYKLVGDVNRLNNTKSNEGEYGFQDANIISQSQIESKKWKSINVYGNGSERLLDSAEFFSSLDKPRTEGPNNNQPYPSFNRSTYSPLSILLSQNPQGDNGLLSQDSFIAKLGAQTLREEFKQRIAVNIKKETIGRANVFNVRSGTDILEMLTGRVPLIEPNWTITIPENPIVAVADFSLKLAGAELPVSPIPGSYFDPNINPKQPTTIQQLAGSIFGRGNNFFNKLLGAGQTGSELMYANMGSGQKSRLFGNINYNKYKPSFDRTLFDRLAGVLFGNTTNNANYYVGSITSNPSRVFSPSGDLPVDVFGKEVQSPVYGPSELSKLYEGPNLSVKLGANGVPYTNGGGIEGGFTWVSPKYKGNAGKKVGPGGQTTSTDSDFRPSSYESTESTNQEYREGSILYDTQKLIDSQPQGGKRLQHVGNAIDQVSKVFNDGYKEITKGSKVLSYVGPIGQEVGTEYCRIFAKDIPYLQYNDLQKTNGIVTEGRRFSWSVLDKTYNLNIAPNKQEGGQDSSNLIGNPSLYNSYAKKYMFSLENLAWRTSNTPGLTVADLPVCERGPNGGRVMWFPPYDLKFNEAVSANWKTNSFIGRPEPIYTYENTNRSGSLSWKIVVDHPSVLNIIVNKVLEKETNKTRIDSMLESFFAGCLKYDLYELAKKYYNVKPDDLRVMQKVIGEKEVTKDQIEYIKRTVQNGSTGNDEPIKYTPIPNEFGNYRGTAFYFENDYPLKGGTTDYNTLINSYTAETNVKLYEVKAKEQSQQVISFFSAAVESNFNRINELIDKIDEQLKKYTKSRGVITINLIASASAPASERYNESLSQRRVKSAKDYLLNSPKLRRWFDEKRIVISERAVGEIARSQPLQKNPQTGEFTSSDSYNCSPENEDAVGGDVTVGSKEIFTVGAMACRRTVIDSIDSTLEEPVTPPQPEPQVELVKNVIQKTVKEPIIETKTVDRNNITKFVVRQLLTECDYFESIKQDSPLVYDNLKQKLKFFQPAFHSITPEGLNSRLTFLQQCMRPGDTIPVVKEIDGGSILEYNNATNTAFGTPPVLILRVGDFYHTKIIPTSLTLSYEDTLDLNPEGIGVQPMIATVQMQFNFVGGHGLKNSIDKLQNALTFNYYANTEIYDDRADVTDDSLTMLDAEFLDLINTPAPPTINQADPTPGQSNGNTIGVVVSKEIGDYETGTINYSDFMVNFKDSSQKYFQTVVAKIKQSVVNYNNAVRQVWMYERNYTVGNTTVGADLDDVFIFGKPSKIESRFEKITKQLEKDINNNLEGFINFMSAPSKNFSERALRQIKRNYIDFINRKSSFYQNQLTSITTDLVNEQTSFTKTVGKANIVVYKGDPALEVGTDGFEQDNGLVVIYNTSGTTQVSPTPTSGATNTYQELRFDFLRVREDIQNFQKAAEELTKFTYSVDKNEYQGKLVLNVNKKGLPLGYDYLPSMDDVFVPFSKKSEFQNKTFRRVYMLISDDVTDDKKYEQFKKAIIGNIVKSQIMINNGRDNFEEVFDTYWKNIALPLFKEENSITIEFIDHMEKNKLKDYLNYTPFDKKERMFTFTTKPTNYPDQIEAQTKLIKGLGATKNPSSNFNTWNDVVGVQRAYTSKIKLG
jgi:hypothetical protein